MTDRPAQRPDEAAVNPEPAAEPQRGAETSAAETGGSETAPMQALAREAAESKDKLLRALAEMENLRRRTEREVADVRQYGTASFARDVLAIADNLQRALDAVGPELRERADPAVKALIDGVELTERELLKALEKNGVRRFEPQGERFDPNVHQAMFELADPSVPAGTVAQVVQPGYMIGERVLRPALVAVAKGGPKPAPAEAPANDNAGAES
jgi:molecular chaperone GrpE